ncbi:Signal transduction histidine kinase [Goodfellowiella coeruleoviolacea]|uniref:histidine kinase n=1 Tax=Goodfellowiella coeruleoviolacea TaxID=334858 RepID=A0AAE3KHX7_9PSEU|nr:Signal transduction histidine kinase [Goodfellowiella coeruleoviolacea]
MRPAGIAAEIGLAVLFAVALAGTAVAIATSWGGGYWQFDCAVGAVVCGLALLRRRNRVWAAGAGLAVAALAILAADLADLPREPGPAAATALAVLVGSAVRALPARPAVAIAAGGLAVVAGSLLTAPRAGSAGAVPVVAAFSGAVWFTALVAGLGLRLRDARRRATTEQVRRHERLELARELHDVVTHHITGIVVQAHATRIAARKHPESVPTALEGITTAGSAALAALRRVVGVLRDGDDAAPVTPGPERLRDLVDRFGAHGPGVRLRLPAGEDESAWPPEVTSTVYRVVQESLTNIARHAPHARSVDVTVTRDRDVLTVEVSDDGPATPARPHHRGYGLVGMGERVAALGGTLQAGPRPEAGWTVRATLSAAAPERR